VLARVKESESWRSGGDHRVLSLKNFFSIDVGRNDITDNRARNYVPVLTSSFGSVQFSQRWREVLPGAVGATHLAKADLRGNLL
jgi:hypothetical protein